MAHGEPFYVDVSLKQTLDDYLIQAIRRPNLWHPQLDPISRRFYIFGHPGMRLHMQVSEYFRKYPDLEILTQIWDPLASLSPQEELKELQRSDHQVLIRIVMNGDAIFQRNVQLEPLCKANDFVIVIGHHYHLKDNVYFDQFDHCILISPLSSSQAVTIIKWRFNQWTQHMNDAFDVDLDDADYHWLESCCTFVTYKDVYAFCRRVFTANRHYLLHDADKNDEEQIFILNQMELEDIDNKLLYSTNPSDPQGVKSIIPYDGRQLYNAYRTQSGRGPLPKRTGKRPREKSATTSNSNGLFKKPKEPSSSNLNLVIPTKQEELVAHFSLEKSEASLGEAT